MKRIVTGLKPSGELTLGNYIGVIKNLIKLQEEYEVFIFIADLHAITVRQEAKDLRRLTKEFIALYLACGFDKEKIKIFKQSEIKAHAQLGYIMMCNSYLGELNRMTQYKDKVSKDSDSSLSAGFYIYPSLMAADILLYDADYVYVGADQKQHLELTKTLATRFNNYYSETFKIPEYYENKKGVGKRVMNLQDPTKKMSKSEDNNKGCIFLLDDLNIIKKKIKSAVTDSDTKIFYDKTSKPGISNLLEIYAIFTNKDINEVESYFSDKSYSDLKTEVADVVVADIEKIQIKYKEILNSNIIEEVLEEGRQFCERIANKKLFKVERKIGLR